MEITITQSKISSALEVNINGKIVGLADYNYEDEIQFQTNISLTAEQLIAIGQKLKTL